MSDIDYDILRIQSVVSITAALITTGRYDPQQYDHVVEEAVDVVDRIMEKESFHKSREEHGDELPGSDLGNFVQ